MTATPLRATQNNNNSNSRPLEKFPFDMYECEKMKICLERGKKSFFASKWKIMCVCVFVETAAWRSLIWIRRIRGPFLHFCLLRKGRQPTMRMKNIRKCYLETTCLRCCLFCVYLFIFSVRGFRWWKQKKILWLEILWSTLAIMWNLPHLILMNLIYIF